jgi:hypothetical protein
MKLITYKCERSWTKKSFVWLEKITEPPGVDVMITIFCDFQQFSAKKLALFTKTNVKIKFLNNLALFWVKNANFFADFFGENILKSITAVPGAAVTQRQGDQIGRIYAY